MTGVERKAAFQQLAKMFKQLQSMTISSTIRQSIRQSSTQTPKSTITETASSALGKIVQTGETIKSSPYVQKGVAGISSMAAKTEPMLSKVGSK